jgi:polysaccharide biosynthesis transport protein
MTQKMGGVMDKSLTMLLSVLLRRGLPGVATFVSAIAVAIAYLVVTPSVYEARGRLILDEKQVSLSELGRNLSQLSSHTPGGSSPLATQTELIKSPGWLTAALERAALQHNIEDLDTLPPVSEFKNGLKIKLIPATNILEITYENEDPQIATNLVNSLLKVTVEKSREAIQLEARSIRQFLESTVPEQRIKVEMAEVALNQYREESGLVAVDAQTQSLVDIIAIIHQQESLVIGQVEEAKQRLASIQELGGFDNIPDAFAQGRMREDELLGQLRARLNEIESELIQAESRFTNQHPAVQLLRQEQAEIQSLYRDQQARIPNSQGSAGSPGPQPTDRLSQDITERFINAETEYRALENRLQGLRSQRIALQLELDRLPIKEQQLSALMRERDEAVESLNFLQNKLAEARIAEAQLVSNLRIMEEGIEPVSPSSPKKKVVLVLAIAAGGAMAISLILLLELLDPRVNESWEVEGLLNLPLLGILPDVSPEGITLSNPNPFLNNKNLVEPYRLLLKTLEFRTQNNLRPIVISSTVAGEGKSFVAAHLGSVAAMLSRRTLIIDADLHDPSQHYLCGVAVEPGLTDALTRPVALSELVQPTGIENLWVLSCGETKARPAEFLESPAMQALLVEAASLYDVVIVDTPPLVECADAHTLSQHSQGLVAVVRPQFTQKSLLVKSINYLQTNGVPVLGFAIDQMSRKTEKSYRKATAESRGLATAWNPRVSNEENPTPWQPSIPTLVTKGLKNGKS